MTLSLFNRLKPKSEFSRNVLTLLTGTTIAQAIPIAVAPILTRIYSPEDFGVFALFVASAAIMSVLATGRYELAIMLPHKDSDAATLVKLSILISVFVSFITLLIVLVFNDDITNLLGNPEISNWLYFTPLSVLLTGIYQSLNYWSNRKKEFKRLAISRITQNSTMSASQVGIGLSTSSSTGLIIGDILGKLIATSILFKITWKKDKKILSTPNKKDLLTLAKRYKKFPIYDTGASLANISSYQAQNILFPIFYGLASAGYYFLVLKVLQAPLSLISGALTDVYRQKLTAKETTPEQLKIYYKKMLLFLFLIGIPPFTLIFLFAENIFIFLFGQEWSPAGTYASILSPMFFIRFIASPLSFFLYLKEKQEVNIIGNLLLFLSCLVLVLGVSDNQAVQYISILFSIIYLVYIYYSGKLAGAF